MAMNKTPVLKVADERAGIQKDDRAGGHAPALGLRAGRMTLPL
jgi:hypothetical protein